MRHARRAPRSASNRQGRGPELADDKNPIACVGRSNSIERFVREAEDIIVPASVLLITSKVLFFEQD